MDASLKIEKKKNSTINNNHRGSGRGAEDTIIQLKDLLKQGMAVVPNLWNYNANDWVSSVQAADVDNDGDIEVLVGSRDGFVRVLTRGGSLKWETSLGHEQWVSAVFAVPPREEASARNEDLSEMDQMDIPPCVIAGTRDGKIYALDQDGRILPNWHACDTGQGVRSIYIDPLQPERIIVGSESGGVYVLKCANGQPAYDPFITQDSITSVFAYDVDGDDELEILAGCSNGCVYILNFHTGELKKSFPVHNKIYALHATHLEPRGNATILVSTGRKDLTAWTITTEIQASGQRKLKEEKAWTIPNNQFFTNRVHTIAVADINHDTFPEILVGSEDQHFYVLDHTGKLLWKHAVDATVSSIATVDINFDGLIEVIVGLEDNQVRVFHINLISSLHESIATTYKSVVRSRKKVTNDLPYPDYMLLKDLIPDKEPQPPMMELGQVNNHWGRREYDQALTILLRLNRQHVQYYWETPITNIGHLRASCLGDVAGDEKDEIMLGNDEGQIFAIDIERARKLWVPPPSLRQRIRIMQMGTTDLDEYDTLLVSVADDRVHILNNKGKTLQDKEVVVPGERIWCLHITKQGAENSHEIREILIGTEQQIYIYDANLQKVLHQIPTQQGIKIISTYDLTEPGSEEIICAGMDNQVYVYCRKTNKMRWQYPTQDRIRAICIKDIDGDGSPEIIVGSEDRYVYVLDCNGHLKWRYCMPHRVLCIDALDIDQDEKCEILVGVADSYMYVIDPQGDLRWKFKANDRIRAIHAKDMNEDDKPEIAVISEDQIILLQPVNPIRIKGRIDACFKHKLEIEATTPENGGGDLKKTILKMIESENEYVRAFGLTLLAGQNNHTQQDFTLIQDALQDKSLEVRKSMPETVINLWLTINKREQQQDNIRQIRRILTLLSSDPNQEVRVTLINQLDMLIEMDSSLCFEYLQRFTSNGDIWVRRAVTRQLSKLVKDYPEKTLDLLKEMVQDTNDWIRQECGRSLAHYFDTYSQNMLSDLQSLLLKGIDALTIEQISYSARNPLVKSLFNIIARLLNCQAENDLPSLLDEAIITLHKIHQAGIDAAEDVLEVYEELKQLLGIRTRDAIVRYAPIINLAQQEQDDTIQTLTKLRQVVEALKTYQRRQALNDRASSLLQAYGMLEDIRSFLNKSRDNRNHTYTKTLLVCLPEDFILDVVHRRWSDIVTRELRQLRGIAQLTFSVPEQTTSAGEGQNISDEQITITLVIANKGRCPADNVEITLQDNPEQFVIHGEKQKCRVEIPTSSETRVEFTISPRKDTLDLAFIVQYDDAEQSGRSVPVPISMPLHIHGQEFEEIPNPYITGAPIRTSTMFFGREEDLNFLREKLTNAASNTFVILTGQRRAGKTSLIYQLTSTERQWLRPHVPVFIDLQSFAQAPNTAKLLNGIANIIYQELRERTNTVPRPNETAFERDATSSFNHFLRQVLENLGGNKLVLLFDEFEMLEQKMNAGQLDKDFLQYLRSIMQHNEGINFLLAGAPSIRNLNQGYWSIFFNSTITYKLSKLKPTDAQRLIEEPVEKHLHYDRIAIEKIHQLTGDQPFLINRLCDTLIHTCNKLHKGYVNVHDVNIAAESMLENDGNLFAWIWENLAGRPETRFVFSCLAQEQGEERHVLLTSDLREQYTRCNIRFDEETVLQHLRFLADEEFVEKSQDDIQFSIPVGLIRGWVQKVWPPERVVRTEKLTRA